jgi:glycosyltransferase involved in cell wall biosynthesis
MRIVLFNKTLISGGIEKCIETLTKALKDDYEFEVCYYDDSIVDDNIVNIISKYAKVTKLTDGMKIKCDKCVWSFLYFDYYKYKDMIEANEYIAWIHSMPRILPDCLLDNEDFVNDCSKFICVSEAVKNNLNISKEGMVIHNFLNDNLIELSKENNPLKDIDKDTLKLSVVSRISSGKGFERLLLLVKELEEEKVPYIVNIIGKGRKREQEYRDLFKDYKNVVFVGYRDNPYNYVKNSDYLVQLSDDESWCNSITEAKVLGVPVVVTNFESSYEQVKDGYNGIMVDLNETDYKKVVRRMLTEKEVLINNLKDFKYAPEIKEWKEVFE